MDLDARGIVPRPWQSLLRALIVRLVLHALNDDGAPDGTPILRASDSVGTKRLMGFEPMTFCTASTCFVGWVRATCLHFGVSAVLRLGPAFQELRPIRVDLDRMDTESDGSTSRRRR